MVFKNTLRVLLTAVSVLIAVYFIAIAFCMRPAGDDLLLLALLREKGFTGSVTENFTQFNFRHVPLLLFNSLYTLVPAERAYALLVPLFYLCLLGILFAACTAILEALHITDRAVRLQAAALFIGTLYFGTFQSIEIFTYMTDILYYLTPVIFTVAALALILTKRSSPLIQTALAICACVAGSGVENYSLGLLLFLSCFMIFRLNNNRRFFESPVNRKLIVCLFSLSASAILVYLAPGTQHRPAIEQQFVSEQQRHSVFSFLSLFLSGKMIFVLLFLGSWLCFNIPADARAQHVCRQIIAWSGFAAALFLSITLLVSYRVFYGHIPERSFFPFNFAFTVFLIAMVIYLRSQFLQDLPAAIAFLTCGMLAIVFLAYSYTRVPGMVRYASAYDKRVLQMTQFNKSAPLLLLEPLPQPGVLLANEIDADSSAYTNKITQQAYGLGFAVALKK